MKHDAHPKPAKENGKNPSDGARGESQLQCLHNVRCAARSVARSIPFCHAPRKLGNEMISTRIASQSRIKSSPRAKREGYDFSTPDYLFGAYAPLRLARERHRHRTASAASLHSHRP